MDRTTYMQEFERYLRAKHLPDIDMILEEYNEHFDFKLADGYSEEEIAARLGSPKDLSAQFTSETVPLKGAGRVVIGIGLGFSDLVVSLATIPLFAWVVVLGAFAVVCAATGVFLITGLNIAALIPYMPYAGALLLGVACIALAVLAAVGTIYSNFYSVHLVKLYANWHRRVLAGGGHTAPPMAKFPRLTPTNARKLRTITMAGLVIFGVSCVVGLVVLIVMAGFEAPWHHWGWFVR